MYTTSSYVRWVQAAYTVIRLLAAKEHYIHSCFEVLCLNKQQIFFFTFFLKITGSKNTFHIEQIGALA